MLKKTHTNPHGVQLLNFAVYNSCLNARCAAFEFTPFFYNGSARCIQIVHTVQWQGQGT